jgi:galactose mutarotase-like enzyme
MADSERVLGAGGDVELRVDAAAGGRISSLRIRGEELLVPRSADPLAWGCYPMAPFAGRLRNGEFLFGAHHYRMPRNMPPHAIHGTVFTRPWEWVADDMLETRLGDDWPWPGHAELRLHLSEGAIRVSLEVHASERPFPASAGFHPWFRRQLGRGAPLRLDVQPGFRYACDDTGIPNGELLPPGEGPWDDTFTGFSRHPVVEWPGALRVELSSDHAHWVIYDRPSHAVCVEPLTAPPNALNGAAHLVSPGNPLRIEMSLRWQELSA